MNSNVARFPTRRYTTVAIILHWVIAVAIIGLLASGLWMSSAINDPASKAFAFAVFQWHKALGLTVLVLSLARLAWRIGHNAPALPGHMTQAERMAAAGTHVLFYGLMIGMPLVGWAMVSASPIGLPTLYFGLFEWPHLPILSTLADKAPVEATLKTVHMTGGYIFAALLVLHVAAALKHHLFDRDDVLLRMLPGPARPAVRPAGVNGSGVTGKPAPTARQGASQQSRVRNAWLPFAALLALAAAATAIWPVSLPRSTGPAPRTELSAPASPVVAANRWTVDPRASRIAFAGTHAGSAFKGTFERWTADIVFDPADLPRSTAKVKIDLASARTGDQSRDTTLPGADWFDLATTSTATFETLSIASKGGSSYVADGRLSLRGVTLPVALAFDLAIEGRAARMTGKATIRRLDFGIGKGSDSSGSWISLDIPVDITVVATRG